MRNGNLKLMVLVLVGCCLAGCQTARIRQQADTAAPGDWLLLPAPREISISATIPPASLKLDFTQLDQVQASSVLRKALLAGAASFTSDGSPSGSLPFTVAIDPQRMPQPQGYSLAIAPTGVELIAHDAPGLFYGAQTLFQLGALVSEKGEIPLCQIRDWPDFPHRGAMIDVARDKVPEMKTLYALVDRFASWKYNQLQLYTEHTFAYKGHHVVWQDASPMTPAQIRDLDAYCKERFIDLVPNQNSFGHMGRWLAHPEYADLAETPNGSDLCPVDPRSIELLHSMYDFMLPNFSSPYANVGCDETWSLGKGRSAQAVAEKGVGRVYLEFLLKIRGLVQANGKEMQFWGDIINNHPELIPELPKDLIAMEWGYEAASPFAEHAQRFHDNGVRFYVVPGTSTWNTLLGRTDNALANMLNAAENGLKFGGEGFLVTEWGDGGHWQFLPVSLLPFAYGAAVSWCVETNRDIDIASAASRYAFDDAAKVMGSVAFDLGNAYKHTGGEYGNNSTFYLMLQHHIEKPLADAGPLKPEDLEETIAYIDATLARMDQAQMQRPDAELIKSEFTMNAAMAKLACKLGAARLRAGGVATSALPREVRLPLAEELATLLDDYRQLWLARNRSGGLKESAGGLENLVALLRQ